MPSFRGIQKEVAAALFHSVAVTAGGGLFTWVAGEGCNRALIQKWEFLPPPASGTFHLHLHPLESSLSELYSVHSRILRSCFKFPRALLLPRIPPSQAESTPQVYLAFSESWPMTKSMRQPEGPYPSPSISYQVKEFFNWSETKFNNKTKNERTIKMDTSLESQISSLCS